MPFRFLYLRALDIRQTTKFDQSTPFHPSFAELHNCAGLAFTTVSKGGFGLSYTHGRGFVIAKYPSDIVSTGTDIVPRLPWTWSAPLFITVNASGLGATVGYAEIDSITILDNVAAVKSFTKNVVEVDTDINAAAGGAAAASLPATAVNLSDPDLSDKRFTYSVAKGAIVDVSLTGVAYNVDTSRNEAAYGTLVTPATVLEGGVRPPQSMNELYRELDKIIQEYRVQKEEPVGGD